MEEKERYELNDNDCIIDNEKDVAICDVCDVSESPETLVDLLNQQDKRIKDLQSELKSQPAEIVEKIRNLAEKDFDFDTCTCCGEDVHDDVVLTKNDFNKILENCLTVKN